ncbi:right-handed parallel beta-helix repeat-containing protein [Niabella sp.]|uniref:right-handed parallel beta-helix repeat-containing protein n=1 Tax=Niabella sp. TaxID=1962976 RepID=UPI0026192CF3|nr:right-handed parallel beta-helix repeat-containing protein [Niabella sp.]
MFFLLCAALLQAQTPDGNGIVYIKPTASGTGSGNSWANATADLQGAINTTGVQKVFVAIGTYYVPSPNSFVMKDGVGIYGGFDPANNISTLADARILPGTGGGGSILDGKNERPVILNNNNGVTSTARLDGFALTHASGSTNDACIYNTTASPVLSNLLITGNAVGGIININNSSPVLTNITITQSAYAGFLIRDGNPTLTNVTIAGNPNYAIFVSTLGTSTLTIKNSIIYGTVTDRMSYASAQHSLVENNAISGNNNLDATGVTLAQVFNNPAAGDYTLKSNSPAINSGNNALYPGLNISTKDLSGKPRLFGAAIDLGAYEYQDKALPVLFGSVSATIKDGQLLVNWRTETETGNDHFLIQVSQDGIHWKTVQTVQSKAPDGNSDKIWEYSSTIPLASLSLGAGFLLLGVLAFGRKKHLLMTMAVILSAITCSCSKRDFPQLSANENLFVRIVQVDTNGSEQVSKVVTVVEA